MASDRNPLKICPLNFKSEQCGYEGHLATCDKSVEDCKQRHGDRWWMHYQGWIGDPVPNVTPSRGLV